MHTLHPNAFVPRILFGEYLEDLLAKAETVSPRLRKIAAEAIDLVPLLNGSFRIEFSASPPLIADQVVLALGNFPPGDPSLKDRAFHQSDRYLVDAKLLFADLSHLKELDSGLDYLSDEQRKFLENFWLGFDTDESVNKKKFIDVWRKLYPRRI